MKKSSKPLQPGQEQEAPFGKGHGTNALGPSDTSDSCSDIQGGPGLREDEVALGLDTGTTSDPDRRPRRTAGPDVGDANLDSDSDASGTGEHATAGRDYPWEEGADISTDTIVDSPDDPIAQDEDDSDELIVEEDDDVQISEEEDDLIDDEEEGLLEYEEEGNLDEEDDVEEITPDQEERPAPRKNERGSPR